MSEEAHAHRAQANIHEFYQNFVKSCQTLDSLLLQRLLYAHSRRLLDFCQIYLMLCSLSFDGFSLELRKKQGAALLIPTSAIPEKSKVLLKDDNILLANITIMCKNEMREK